MSDQRVGTCSICGGSVMGVRGPWWSVSPPPPDKCSQCGAVAQSDIIKMHPTPKPPFDFPPRGDAPSVTCPECEATYQPIHETCPRCAWRAMTPAQRRDAMGGPTGGDGHDD